MKYFFDLEGRLIGMRTTNSNELRVFYEKDFEISKIVCPGGQEILFSYRGGKISKIEDTSAERVLKYFYEEDNLVKVYYPSFSEGLYIYENDLLVELEDQNNNRPANNGQVVF